MERSFNANIVIFRLGENVIEKDKPFFKPALKKFINHICPNGKTLFTTCFWKNDLIDDVIKKISAERKELCINCCFSNNDRNMALGKFEHQGVATHPSDEGMEAIADAIFNGLNIYLNK